MTTLQSESGRLKPASAPPASAPIDLEEVRRHFVFEPAFYPFSDADTVEDFLRQRPFLVELILEARLHIRRYFGAECRLALAPFYDPEDPQYHYLTLLIQSTLPVAEEMQALERFDEEWWLAASERAQGLLNISLR